VVWNHGSCACFVDKVWYVWHILGHFDCDYDGDILAIVIIGVTGVGGGLDYGLYHSRTWFGELLGSIWGFMAI
jgi:hypothetical protein